MVWYSQLFKNFSQFVVIHTVKGFSIVNEAEVDVFLELPCFLHDSVNVGNLISGSSAFKKMFCCKFLIFFIERTILPCLQLLEISIFKLKVLKYDV